MTKRKDRRRELLKDDEFHTILEQWALKIKEEPKKYLGITLAVFIALALIFGYLGFTKQSSLQQAATLFEAEKIMNTSLDDPDADYQFETQKQKLEAALVEIDKAIAEGSTSIKAQAKALKVKVLIDLGQVSELESLYKDLANSRGGFKIQGLIGLGDLYMSQKKYDDALAQYNQLANGSGSNPDLEDLAKLKMAECYEAKGDVEAAKRELTELVGRYPEDEEAPPSVTEAKTLLEKLQ